jgi:LacI family gluconate utilization system Gnt-I transcriptional repressor
MGDDSEPRRRKSFTRASGVTIHDVARLAGVSIITVSRALNSPEQVSAKTLERVQEAIARTNYVPNLMAGGLRSARSRLVVALVPTLAGQLFINAIQSLTHSLEAKDYQLILGQIGYFDSREDRLLDAIIGRRPDGIVLTGIMHSADGRRRLIASGIPVVETWDFTPTPIDMLVGFSHERVGQEVCEFLVRRGRQRLALISANDARARLRETSFRRAAATLGVRPPHVELVEAPATHASGRSALSRVLEHSPDIDAVFCSSDMLALGVLTEARARGIAVPGDFAVIGFGDLDFAATLYPALTSVRIDGAELGRIAAGFIVDRAEGREVPDPVVDIGFTIVERESA